MLCRYTHCLFLEVGCLTLAGNGQGLALLGDLKIVCRQLKPIEKLMLKLTTKSQIEKRRPVTEAPQRTKAEAANVQPQ